MRSREVVCFHWGMNWIFKYYLEGNYCLCGLVVTVLGYRSRGPGSIPGATRFFWPVVDLERGPLSLVSPTQELLGRNSSGSGLETREYGRGDPSLWLRDTLYPQTLAFTSPTRGGRSVGIVSSWTKVTDWLFSYYKTTYALCSWFVHLTNENEKEGSRRRRHCTGIYVELIRKMNPLHNCYDLDLNQGPALLLHQPCRLPSSECVLFAKYD
jgi:hypothetical protein